MESKQLTVFTDGSSKGNGSAKSKAGCSIHFPEHPDHSRGYLLPEGTTNNRAELSGCVYGIEVALEMKSSSLLICTDSKLIFDTFTKWIQNWKARGWKTAGGKPVANLDLVQKIDELAQKLHVEWKHVRAHTGGSDYYSVNNAIADKLATSATD